LNFELYKQKKVELIENTKITNNYIFDYDISPYFDEFDKTFSFYQETLKLNSKKYGISPNIIFYNNLKSSNAWAGKYNDYFIVSFNMGLIMNLIETFKENEDLLKNASLTMIEFEKKLDSPIHQLMYENTVHFTFYHEMAHLIQKSDLLENKIFEHLDNSGGYSENNHLLELDADKFSSLSMGSHILQYAEKIFGKEFTKEEFENLLLIFCSSIFLYLLSFESNKVNLYYEKYKHPHPIIRILVIIFTIVGYCTESLKQKGVILNINTKDVINKTFGFCETISNQFFQDNRINKFYTSLQEEGLEILTYIKKLEQLSLHNKSLSVYKWNQMAEKIHAI
jgi:hypothetical protein